MGLWKKARRADKITWSRYSGNLRDILRFAWPHWKPIVASLLLMVLQSTAGLSRIIMILPVATRVLGVEQALDKMGEDELTADEAQAKALLATYRDKGGSTLKKLDDFVSWSNQRTQHLMPEAWLPKVPETVADLDLPPELTPEEQSERLGRAQARATMQREVALDRTATLITLFFVFLVLTFVMSAAAYYQTFFSALGQHRILIDVRETLCRKLLDQPVSFFDAKRRGELVQRALGDVMGYAAGLMVMLGTLPRSLIQLMTALVLLVILSPTLTLLCLVGIPFLIPMRRVSRRTLRRAHKRQQESVRLLEVMLQIFSGIRTVKAYNAEEQRAREFRQVDEEVTDRSMKVWRSKATANSLVAFINNFLALTLALGGGFFIMQGWIDVTPVQLVIFLTLMTQLYQPIKRLVRQNNLLLEAMASIERTTEYMKLPAAPPDPAGAVPFEGLTDAIRFENVDFAYHAEQPVLRDISFEIPRGQTVALVGPSGGGKSTLCDLMLRFYKPTSGRIAVDGRDLGSFQRASYLAHTAIVTQAPFLFNDTIGENIRQGRPDATQAEIEAAAKAAHIHDFIVSQPNGYDEIVGEQGVRLSGGQRQRITIARALIRDPDILVLDEATASLDTASERAVQEALDQLREGRTTLVVAHRLSTIKSADRIVVLEHGCIVEQGTHEELISLGGLYSSLVTMQDVRART